LRSTSGFSSNNTLAVAQTLDYARRLPKPGEWTAPESVTIEESEEEAPRVSGNVESQVRQLARLKEDGLISDEEVESKKRDLLDRM
jgi:hypothetical protein